MSDIVHVSPAGAPVLDCSADEVCELIACEICLQEIPASAAQSEEAADYVHYFCGLECLEIWRRRLSRSSA